jgi:catechol 2,3-dioxygenase-like lactoylglutathione lyase family enzyme
VTDDIGQLLSGFEHGRISRRTLLLSLPAIAAARGVFAQSSGPPIRVRALNHATLMVSDVKRSTEFYQGLFGMPIQGRQGGTVALRIGSGPQALALSAAGSGAPSINHFCLAVEDFNVDRLVKTLTDRGLTKAEGASGGLGGGPMKIRVRMRGPEVGGAPQGTPELYFGDPDGIVVQLQDPSYCGGGGPLGNVCSAVEPAPTKGLIAVRDLSHFTVFVSDSQRSNTFYRELFGFSIRSYQGPTAPTLAVGRGVEFLMFAGVTGGGRGGVTAAPPRPASINHLCLNLDGFNTDRILKALESYGIKPRENAQGPVGPMRSYVTMRMENRGGAKEGTPELYLTDPDGILVQLQDVRYCGGSGVLGDGCPA